MSLHPKPIPYKRQKFVSGGTDKIQLDSGSFVFSDSGENMKYVQIKNMINKNIEVIEGNTTTRSNLLEFFKNSKHTLTKRGFNLSIILGLTWNKRIKLFTCLSHYLQKFGLLQSLNISIDFCLDISLIDSFFRQLGNLKHLTKLRIDLTKFYNIPISFIKHLARLIQSFTKLECLEIIFQKTPEMSLNDDFFPLFQAFRRLTKLRHLSFSYLESIQIKKYSQKESLFKIIKSIENINIQSFSLNIKSNSFTQDILEKLLHTIGGNTSLRKLHLELQDVENLLDTSTTANLLEQLTKRPKIASIDIKNTLENISNKEIELLNLNVLKLIESHPNLERFNIKVSTLSYFNGMKLASSFRTLHKLETLILHITKSNDLILLQEIGHLQWLKNLEVTIEFELDTSISGFLESLESLCDLRALKLECKKKIPRMFFQKEDYMTLFKSLSRMKNIRKLFLWFPIVESSKFQFGGQEFGFITNFIQNATCLENCVIKAKWDQLSVRDLYSLYEAALKDLRIKHFEIHLGLSNFGYNLTTKALKFLQTEYKNEVNKAPKLYPKVSLATMTT